MLAKLRSLAVLGIDAFEIIEADTSEMLPGLTIVGLPDSAVQESREESCPRSKTAVSSSQTQNHHQYGTCGYEKKGSVLICQSL